MKKTLSFRSFKVWLLIFFEYLKRYKLAVAITAAIIAALFFAQFKLNLFYNSNNLSIGFIGTYQEHDLPLEVTRLISQPLVVQDKEGRAKANLVSGWETNNDATNFKFKLKDGLKWADNSPVLAKDVSVAIPEVEGTTPDDKTIEFRLKEAYSPFPTLLTRPIFKKGTLIGTGPYSVKKIEHSRIFITKIELEAVNPKLPNISIRFYPNEKVAVTGFNLGEVQALFGFANTKAFTGSGVQLKQTEDYSKIVNVLFQTRDPLLSNRSLRQALAYITPRIKNTEVANNPYPKSSWAYDPSSKKYLDNLEEAKSAMDRAKSQMDDSKLHAEIILTSTPNLEEVGKQVVAAWKKLGFDSKLRVESGIPQNFQALLITQSIPADPDQYVLWHATQTKTNLTRLDSKRVDKDLEDGRKAITEVDRKAKYFDFQKALLEDAPAIFLYFPKYNIAYLKKKEQSLNKVLELMD